MTFTLIASLPSKGFKASKHFTGTFPEMQQERRAFSALLKGARVRWWHGRHTLKEVIA